MGTKSTQQVNATKLEEFCVEVLTAVGLKPEYAAILANSLVVADLRGIESHGVSRIPIYAKRLAVGVLSGDAEPVPLTDSGPILLLDGCNAPGAVVAHMAMQRAIEKAREFGVGVVSVRRSNHFGAAGYYAADAADRGFVGIVATNSPSVMTIWGGMKPAIGNNPVAIAAPAGRHGRLLLDMSNSVAARGKIRVAARRGDSIPADWALDAQGRNTTDAEAALGGCILPMAGPKGSGLSVMMDVLSGVLSGANFASRINNQYDDLEHEQGVGHFFCVLDIKRFMPMGEFTDRVEALVDELKACPKAAGVEEVFMPGEIEAHKEQDRRANGIPIDSSMAAALRDLADAHGVAVPSELSAERWVQ